MSTFERMLQVLGNRDAAGRDGSVANVLSRVLAESRLGAGRRARRRASSRRGRRQAGAPFATEQLEQRQVLALTTFAQAPYTLGSGVIAEGWATVVAEGGDNVFIQQVAGKSQSLWVADNSSFNNATVVGGPAAGTAANWQLPGVDVNTLSSIQLTSGTLRRDVNVQPAGYPMSADYATRFTLSSDGLNTSYGNELSGTISIVQPDGRTEKWTFSNATPNGYYYRYDGEPTFRTGIGVIDDAGNYVSPKPGDYFPTAIRVASRGYQRFGQSEIEVVWNVRQLPVEPRLDSVKWYSSYGHAANNQQYAFYVESYQYQSDVRPAAGARTFIPLPNAAGPGLNPILPATFSGTIIVDGVSLNVTAGDPTSPTTLRFNGESEGLIRGFRFWNRTGLNGQGYWSENPWMQTIRGRLLTGTQADGYRRGLELTMSGDFPVLLESARYALPAGGDPVTATVFAGQNITSALDVNLVQPGSKLRLDSPVLVAAGRSGISVRASSIEFNAPASTDRDLTVGPAQVDSAQALEAASAVAQIVDGKLSKIILPSGGWGAGYDADNLPTVRIDEPTSEQATATVTGLANGRVDSIDVTAAGTKYTAAPSVTISAPTGSGRTAKATAEFSLATGAVTGFIVTDSGSGYNRAPLVTINGTGPGATGRANVVGSLATGVVKITNPGVGYAPNSSLPLTITGEGTGAAGIAKVDANGTVTSIEITSGGDGYTFGTTRISIPAPSANPSPQVAKATAIVDRATTRIIGFTIDDPGSLYGRVPNVTISPPLAVSNAIRPLATIDAGGRVTGVTFGFGTGLKVLVTGVSRATGAITNVIVQGGVGGSGYAVGDLASIDSSGKD